MIMALGRYGAFDSDTLTETDDFSWNSLGLGGLVRYKCSKLDSVAYIAGKKVVYRSFD